MRGMSRLLCLVLAAVLLTLAAACADSSHRSPLRVGVSPWVGFDPLVLAQDRRMVDPARVRIVEMGSSVEVVRHLRNGLLEGAALTLGETLRLADEGVALRIVAVLDVSDGADAVLADPSIHDPAALRGKRIAMEDSALAAMILERLLEAGGLGADAVRVLHTEASYHESALRSGRVNAVITYEPMKSRLAASGYGVVFDSRSMPDEIVDVLVLRTEVLERRPDAVDALLLAWHGGLKALQAKPSEAALLLSNGMDLTPEEYLATLGGLRFVELADSVEMLSGNPAPVTRGGEELARTLRRLGLIEGSPEWETLLAPQAVRRVAEHTGSGG